MESIVNYMEPRDIYEKIGTNASELSEAELSVPSVELSAPVESPEVSELSEIPDWLPYAGKV